METMKDAWVIHRFSILIALAGVKYLGSKSKSRTVIQYFLSSQVVGVGSKLRFGDDGLGSQQSDICSSLMPTQLSLLATQSPTQSSDGDSVAD